MQMTKSPEEFDERDLHLLTADALRAHPETPAVRVSREHYLWLADEIETGLETERWFEQKAWDKERGVSA
jgi:hypothetical protein